MAYLDFGTTALAGVIGDPRLRVIDLVQGFSIETTPKQARNVESFAAVLPRGSRVFIAFIPGDSPDARSWHLRIDWWPRAWCRCRMCRRATLPVCGDFESYVTALYARGVRQALLLAGGARDAAGSLTSSLELLDSGVMEGLGFEQLFVAGHPEGSPDIGRNELAEALAKKNAYARQTGVPVTIVTQFGFDAEIMLAWAQAMGDAGNRLPVRIGVAGPASLTNLVKYAKLCGVNASMNMLTKAGGKLFQLVGQATPDGLLVDLAVGRSGWADLIQDVHFYPFGGFDKTARWAGSVAQGSFAMQRGGSGFTVQG